VLIQFPCTTVQCSILLQAMLHKQRCQQTIDPFPKLTATPGEAMAVSTGPGSLGSLWPKTEYGGYQLLNRKTHPRFPMGNVSRPLTLTAPHQNYQTTQQACKHHRRIVQICVQNMKCSRERIHGRGRERERIHVGCSVLWNLKPTKSVPKREQLTVCSECHH
jgi:hypothetical protein